MIKRKINKPLAVAWILGLLLIVSGCATLQKLNPFGTTLVVTGETLKASAEQFVKVGATYKEGCDVTKTISQSECQKFRAFGEGFQKSFPLSRQLWEAARATNDSETQEGAETVINGLKGKLDKFESTAPAKK